jgi:hypothetical protein
MRKDRIPMNDADEVDEFRSLGWWWYNNGGGHRDSGRRKARREVKRRYNKRLRQAGKEECK